MAFLPDECVFCARDTSAYSEISPVARLSDTSTSAETVVTIIAFIELMPVNSVY